MSRSTLILALCLLSACTFNTSGLSVEDAAPGEGNLSWFSDGQTWSEGGLQLDYGQGNPSCGEPCPLGCDEGHKRCYRLKPSNIGAEVQKLFDLSTGKVEPKSGTLVFNTDNGTVYVSGVATLRAPGNAGLAHNGLYWNLLTQGGGLPQLSVFGLGGLTVASGVTMKVEGSQALVIYATGNVTIDGKVVAPPSGKTPGPGGFAGGAANGGDAPACQNGHGRAGQRHGNAESGGGGGGRKGKGGKGGSSTYGVAGGLGGATAGKEVLVPLFGGCGGGGGGGQQGGYGGGGGAAIQLSANGSILIDGTISVPGAGGGGSDGYAGGGGGGAGGAILLEGHGIQITGFLAANGGGGGGGTTKGQTGLGSAVNASGAWATRNSARGGYGGARQPESGGPGGEGYNGGGGGGGAGYIRLHARQIKFSGPNASPTPLQIFVIGRW